MRKAPYLRYVSLIFVLGLLLAALGWAVSFDATSLDHKGPHNARDEVQAAWERVRAAGSYHFAADLTQRTIPIPTVTNVGRRSRQDALRLEGQTDLREQKIQLTLWSQGGSVLDAADGVQVRVEGDRAFARRGDGAWEEVGDFTGAFAPAGDFLAFLAAARDISRAGQETRAGISFTRYTFGVDGPRFAAYLRDQLQQHLAEQGELPPGVTLDLPRAYVGMTGTGELWIGPDGLPLRQRLELQFPEQDDQRIEAQVTVDFSQFGPITAQAGPVWWGALLSPRQLGQAVLLVVPMLAFSLLLVVHRRSRTVYTALVLAVIASMVVTPLLQSHQLAAFSGRLAARAQAQEERQGESQAQEALRQAALGDPFDPHTDPLVMANTRTGSSPANVFPPLGFAAQSTLTTATCDLSGSQLTPDDDTDTDEDGLTDYQECILGTDAFYFDSDGDTLTDTLEIRGFDLNGQHWYADPLSLDSNSDGIGDIVEWWATEVDNVPGDTDGDGTPDLFDDDNDGDGVLDNLDLSPFQATAREFTRESPLSLVVNDLQPDLPTFVEFQVRPTDPDHLWYAFNVLDWPQGDNEGQMQDTDGATFAQVTGATDAASQNGDVKLVPMLEIQITGQPDNLPATAPHPITDIWGQVVTRTVYPELDNYSIFVQTVQEATPTVKAAYVPLQLTTDPQSGARVAFSGKMLYRPAAEWGQAQQVRLVWVVQALVDHACVKRDAQKECTQYADNQVQVIHAYYDEWFLTGLSVSEDHGSDVAIIYEDPALDPDLSSDDGLIGLVSVLDTTFLVGADRQGDGQRDYVIARHDPDSTSHTLGEVFDREQNGADDNEIEPWGLPDRLRVSSASYDDRDEALMTTVMTETVGILKAAFDLSQPVTPTLLFAREERARSLNLDEQDVGQAVAWQDAALTLDMNASPAPGGRPVETLVGVNWAPYRRDASGAWQAMPLEDYFDEMARRVSATQDPQSAQALATLLVLNADYLALYNGLVNTVQIGERLPPAGGPDDGSDEALNQALKKMYTAPGGQGVEPAAGYLAQFKYPDIPVKEQIQQIAGRGKVVGNIPNKYHRATRLQMGSRVAGRIVLATAYVNLFVVITTQFVDDPSLAIVNSALSLTVSTAHLIATSLSLLKSIAVKAVEVGYKVATVSVLSSRVTTACKVGAAIGLIISIGVSWGFFLYAVFSQDLSGPALKIALAGVIAATVVAILFFVLSLTVIGALVVALLSFIDALMWAIFGFSFIGWVTEQLAKFFYGYSEAVTVKVEGIQLGPLDSDLRDPELGFQAGNALVVRSTMTTTIVHEDPPSNFYDAGTYWDVRHYWSEWNLRSTRFNYAFSAEPANSPTPWQTQLDHWYTRPGFSWPMYRATAENQAVVGQAALQAGINFRPAVQLVSRYDLPGVECDRYLVWSFFGPLFPIYYRDCNEKRTRGGQSTDMSTMVFDVFPADLTAFYSLNWGFHGRMSFGPQRDYDGDGLLALEFGGNDPDDRKWDTDGDGLSDARELELRFQGMNTFLRNPDSDGDDLDDGLEVRLGTDPGWWDSDGDGLSDKEEVDGWDFTYGNGLVMHISSNPLAADGDGDGMSDAAERDLHLSDPERFPYHPRVFNVQPIALRTSLSGDDLVFDQGQAYARPGATLVHTATVRNNLSAAIYAQGELTVSAPPELGGQTQTYPLDYFGGEERSFRSDLSVPPDPDFQEARITSNVSAQLQPDQQESGTFVRQLSEDVTGTADIYPQVTDVAIAPAPSQWGVPYVVAVMEGPSGEEERGERRVALYRAGGDGLIGPALTLDNYEGRSLPPSWGQPALDVACADNGRCLVTWNRYRYLEEEARQVIYGAMVTVTVDGLQPSAPFIVGHAPSWYPAVATDGSDFLIVWSPSPVGNFPSILARPVSNNGDLGPEWSVMYQTEEFNFYFDVAYAGPAGDGAPQYITVWNNQVGNLQYAFVTRDGPGPVTDIVGFPTTGHAYLQVAYDPTGGGVTLSFNVQSGRVEQIFIGSISATSTSSCRVDLPTGPIPSYSTFNMAHDPGSQSWMVAYFWEGGVEPVSVIQAYAPDCTPRTDHPLTTPLRPGYYENDALWLACRTGECAFASLVGTNRIFFDRFDLVETPPAQGALDQSKEDKIQIDNDAPTAAFDTDTYTLAAQNDASTFTLGGAASDPSSGIGRVEVSLDGGSTWQRASGLEAWAFSFDMPPGPGTYQLHVRATDLLGHVSPTASATVHVVSAPPGLDTGIQENALLPATFDAALGRWTLPLNGTVTDTGGGLATVDVRLDPNGSGWQPAVVDAAATPPTWSIDYPLANFDADGAVVTDPSGAYTWAVRAASSAGNMTPETDYLTRQVRVDATPPVARLTAIGGLEPRDVLVISQTVTLSGVVSDTGVLPTGVDGVEVSFTDIQPLTPTLSFQPATLGSPPGALDTTWSFSVPELEGFYQIDARGTDQAGNRNDNQSTWGQWRGEVDTQAPRLAFSAEHRGAGSTARTHYELVATDLNLYETTIDFPPCAGRGRVERVTYDSEWYRAHHGDPTRLYQLTHSCTRPGHQAQPVDVTACDVFDHCAEDRWEPPLGVPLATTGLGQPTLAFTPTSTIYLPLMFKGESAGALPLSGMERGSGGEVSAAALDLDAYIFEPEDASALIAPGTVSVSGGAHAVNNLRSLTVSADGVPIYTQTWPASPPVQDSTWSTTWTPTSAGQHVLTAVVEDWAGSTLADPEPIRIVVALDDQAPTVAISDTFFNAEDLITSNRVDLSGTAASPVGVASVEVSVDGGPWRPTVLEATGFDTANWLFPWALELPPNPSYTVTARVTDAAGRTAEVAETIAVDITPPDPVDITLSYVNTDDASQPLARGQTVRDAQTLVIEWTASADDGGVSGYRVGWTTSDTPDSALKAYPTSDQAHTQAAGEAQALYAHVVITDTAGNWTWQMEGPVYVDAPHTPDLAADLTYHGWMESGCSLIGLDREVSRTAPFAAALDAVQRLYATWSDEALRLTWTGANWEADGDLFIYLDTTGGGATTAFNPYSPAEPTIGLPPGMGADYVLWVEDGGTASLRQWTGSSWAEVAAWTAEQYFQLDTRLSEPHTDVLLPFAVLGNPTSLRLVALASEEEALHLWAAMPDENPRNSPRVISALAADLDVSHFDLTQDYVWPALGSGQCPSAGQFTDSDLRLTLNTNPTGIVVNYLTDDWLVLAPGTRLDTNLLPADVAPAPLGTGDVIVYTLTYANNGTQPATDVCVRLTPFDALQLTNGNVLNLGEVPAGATGSVEFTAQVTAGSDRAAELDAIVSDAAHGDFDWLWSLHPVDHDPPTGLAIHTPRGYVRSGQVTVGGVAQDASGLRQVTLSVSGTEQPPCLDSTPRDGAWTCDWEVPAVPDGRTFQLEVTATDLHGNTSAPASAEVTADNTPPDVVSLDEVVTQALADGVLVPGEFVLSGQVEDNFQAAGARLCFERAEGGHCVDVDARPGDTSAGAWTYALYPLAADGISETLSIYGRDAAGNLSSAPLTREYELDNVGPQVEVTMQRDTIGLGSSRPVMAGTVQDANGVAKMFASLRTPEGEMLWPEVELTDEGDGWSMIMRPPNAPETLGRHTIRLYAQDGFGNLAGYGPFEVEVVEANAIPEVEAGPDQTTDEGSLVSLAPATFHDDNAQDTHTAIINWGDGTQETGVIEKLPPGSSPIEQPELPFTPTVIIYLPTMFKGASDTIPPPAPSPPGSDGTVSGSHVYADNGVYTVEVCVTDSMDNTGCDTLVVTVDNVAPTVDAGPAQGADEGTAVNLVVDFNDKGTLDTHTATITWGDGSPAEAGEVSESPFGPPGSTAGADGTVSGSHVYGDNGTYIVTIAVCDDEDGCGEDSLSITVNNVAPTVDAGPDQTVYRNTTLKVFGTGTGPPTDNLTVSGTWTDPAGSLDDPYSWWWDLDGDGSADSSGTATYGDTIVETTSLALEGFYTLTFEVTDKDGGSGSDSLVIEVLNRPPDCSAASPSIDIIWPADHKFVPINVLGVTDPEQDEIAITIESIYQDEPVDTYGDGSFTPDGQGIRTDTAEVRAERAGTKKVPGNGRVYHIGFSADDGHGGSCSGEVLVGVPHDIKDAPVDEGALYDSTALAP